MRRRSVPLAAVLALVAGVAFATTNFSTGPLPSFTGAPAAGGAPGENNCSICHVLFDEDFLVQSRNILQELVPEFSPQATLLANLRERAISPDPRARSRSAG